MDNHLRATAAGIYNIVMEKTIKNNKEALIVAGTIAAVAGMSVLAVKASSYAKQGLSDSQSIRVAEQTICSSSADNSAEARFVGCNSIL